MSELLNKAYDSNEFLDLGHQVIDLLADYLVKSQSPEGKSFEYFDPLQLYETVKAQLENNDTSLIQWFKTVLDQSIHIHSPNYLGHQVTPVLPIAALTDMLNSLLNNGMGIYEMGSVGTVAEKIVIETLSEHIGFDKTAGGLLTSGGSLANLTALLTARQVQLAKKSLGSDQWCVLVSKECHYSITRTLAIMGCEPHRIITLPNNENGEIDLEKLPSFYRQLNQAQTIIALVASAGTTATGSYDPIEGLAHFCQQHSLWLHVDGAHGGAVVFSDHYRYLTKGLEQADSVIIDFHKLLLTPALTSALIYRNHQQSYITFSQEAHYLFTEHNEDEWYNIGKRTFECTKYMMSLRVFSILKQFGVKIFSDYINHVYDMARSAAKVIQQHKHFELLMPPQSNIICFRYTKGKNLDGLNQAIRKKLIESGPFYLVQTQWRGCYWLRVSWMNPRTTLEQWHQLLRQIESIADTIE